MKNLKPWVKKTLIIIALAIGYIMSLVGLSETELLNKLFPKDNDTSSSIVSKSIEEEQQQEDSVGEDGSIFRKIAGAEVVDSTPTDGRSYLKLAAIFGADANKYMITPSPEIVDCIFSVEKEDRTTPAIHTYTCYEWVTREGIKIPVSTKDVVTYIADIKRQQMDRNNANEMMIELYRTVNNYNGDRDALMFAVEDTLFKYTPESLQTGVTNETTADSLNDIN